MPQVSTGFAPLLSSELQELYTSVGNEVAVEYPFVFNVENQRFNPEVQRKISGLGTMPAKPEGTAFPSDEQKLGGEKSYIPVSYGLKVEVTAELLADSQFTFPRESSAQIARAGRNRMEVDAWATINDAFDATVTGFNAGEALIQVNHTDLDGNTQDNRTAGAVALSDTALQDSITRYHDLDDDRGLPISIRPRLLLIPTALLHETREILGSSLKPFTADNEINSLIEDGIRWMVSRYLTSPTAWFLLADKKDHDLRFKIRQLPKFRSWDDPDTENLLVSGKQRHKGGYGDWRGIDGNPGA